MFLITTPPGDEDALLRRLIGLMYNIESGESHFDWASAPAPEALAAPVGSQSQLPTARSEAGAALAPLAAARDSVSPSPGFLTVEVEPITTTGLRVTHSYHPTVGIIAYVPARGDSWEDETRKLATRLAEGLSPLGYEHLVGFRPSESVDHTVLHRDWGYAPETRKVVMSIYDGAEEIMDPGVLRQLRKGPNEQEAARLIIRETRRRAGGPPPPASYYSAFTWLIVPIDQLLCGPRMIDSPADFNAHMTGIVFDARGLFAGDPLGGSSAGARGAPLFPVEIRGRLALPPLPPELEALFSSSGHTVGLSVVFIIEGGRLYVAGKRITNNIGGWTNLESFDVPEIPWEDANPAGLTGCALCHCPLVGRVYALTGGFLPLYSHRGWRYPARLRGRPGTPILGGHAALLCPYCCGSSIDALSSLAAKVGIRLRATRVPDEPCAATTAQARALMRAGLPWSRLAALADCTFREIAPNIFIGSTPSGSQFYFLGTRTWCEFAEIADFESVYVSTPDLWGEKLPGLCCPYLATFGMTRPKKVSRSFAETIADIIGPAPAASEIAQPPPKQKNGGLVALD